MKQLPPEIENLMWTLAETGNTQAIDEFEARFPHLRIELAKRSNMVRSLRSSKPDNQTTPSIPRFRPASVPAPVARIRYSYAVACLSLAATVLCYAAFRQLQRPPRPMPSVPKVEQSQPSEYKPIDRALPYPAPVESSPGQTSPVQTDPPLREQAPLEQPVLPIVPPEPKWQIAQNVKMSGVRLLTVAQSVALSGGLKLDLAPGMPNPVIDVQYDQTSAADILKDLGRLYAFTPMLSDDGSVILIPAVAKAAGSGRMATKEDHQ